MEEDIAKKQEEERNKIFKNNMEYFYYIVPLFDELLNKNFEEDLKIFVENNEEHTEFGTMIRNFVENKVIRKLKDDTENEKFKLLKNTFSYNFFTTIVKNPENQEFIHHSSPSLYGNNKTDGIYNKEFFIKTKKNNEIYIVITIFAFNNHF
jgi:hypothetical protein